MPFKYSTFFFHKIIFLKTAVKWKFLFLIMAVTLGTTELACQKVDHLSTVSNSVWFNLVQWLQRERDSDFHVKICLNMTAPGVMLRKPPLMCHTLDLTHNIGDYCRGAM